MEKEISPENEHQVDQAYTELSSLTGLYFNRKFMEKAREFLTGIQPDTHCMVAIDMTHFRLFNKFYGRDIGDKVLIYISGVLKNVQRDYGGIAGYFGGDNFCIIMPYQMDLIKKMKEDLIEGMNFWSDLTGFVPNIGICPIDDPTELPEFLYDRATMALSQAAGNYTDKIYIYDPQTEHKLEQEWLLLEDIKTALAQEEFTFFAQPQCDINTGKIVGAEALARWKHSSKGLISPGIFIPVLEKSGFISNLDKYLWKKVCKWLRSWIDKGHRPVPISINVSRIDILSLDVPRYLLKLLDTYQLPARLIKVEITESAYSEDNEKIHDTIKRLRENGFLILMDDFGSGYSSLNMLKSLPIDVLKIDMKFLDIAAEEEHRGIGILESVVNMARLLEIPVIVEGVETQFHENFLMDMGCRYTQGYYYYKPLSINQFEKLLADEKKLDFAKLSCNQVESLHIRELLDGNLFTDTLINNILGPSAFYDVFENRIEITRVNEQYCQMAGFSINGTSRKLWKYVRKDDRATLFSLFEQAYNNRPGCAEGYIHYLRADHKMLWVYMRVFFLIQKNGHKQFYGTLKDITTWQENNQISQVTVGEIQGLTDQEQKEIIQYYGNIPCGYGLFKIFLDHSGNPVDYEIVYANQEMGRICGNNGKRLKTVFLKSFRDDWNELTSKAYHAACLGETLNYHVHSSISGRHFQFTFYRYKYGYAAFFLNDITHMQIHEKTFNSMVLCYREIYFLYLEDNYCRMIYPDEHQLMERGNYEAVVNRHFNTGKILKHDETNVRKFLSLEHLRTALAAKNLIEYRYRRSSKDVEDEWCLTTITICERYRGIPKTAVITIRSIDTIMKEKISSK